MLSARRDQRLAARHGAALDPGARRMLDLCAGTGDLSLEIAARRPGSLRVRRRLLFRDAGARQAQGARRRVAAPATCDALRLPFADGTFDAVTAAFGVRNFEDTRCRDCARCAG